MIAELGSRRSQHAVTKTSLVLPPEMQRCSTILLTSRPSKRVRLEPNALFEGIYNSATSFTSMHPHLVSHLAS